MTRIVLVGCVGGKLKRKAKAKNLYNSPLFKYRLQYAKMLKPDKIFILSAEYGLLDLEKEIRPYNKSLNEMPAKKVREWAHNVTNQLKRVADLDKDEIIFLAGERYRKYLIPHISHHKNPLQGLGIGRQLRFFKENLK